MTAISLVGAKPVLAKICLALLAIGFLAGACSAQIGLASAKDVKIPNSNITIEELHFLPELQLIVRAAAGQHTLCREGEMLPEYTPRSIASWAGRMFVRTKNDQIDDCNFSVLSSSRIHIRDSDIVTNDCISRIEIDGFEITALSVFVQEDVPRNFFQCEFRLKMAIVGFNGALSLPESRLFLASDQPARLYGAPFLEAYSSVMPSAFVHLQWACRDEITPFGPPAGSTREAVQLFYAQSDCHLS